MGSRANVSTSTPCILGGWVVEDLLSIVALELILSEFTLVCISCLNPF